MPGHRMTTSPYGRFGLMILLSFLAMYGLMYAMVNELDNVVHNLNQAYMAGLMAAPMAIIELLIMHAMYPDKKLNGVLIIVSVVALLGCWLGIRQQVGIGDRQFLRSMIPHHSGAILMCRQASLQDAEVLALCRAIVTSQREEITQMKAILDRDEK